MKTTDILSAVRRADKNYIEEASESNVTEKFEKKSFKKVFSAVASATALAALAAFIVLTVSLANKRNDINPAVNGTAENTAAEDTTKEDMTVEDDTRTVLTEAEENATSPEPETEPADTVPGEFKAISGSVGFTEGTAAVKTTVYDGQRRVTAKNSADVPVYSLKAEPAAAMPAADFDVFVHGTKFIREKDGGFVMRRTDHTMLTAYENGEKKWVYDLSPEEYINNWFDISDGTILSVSANNIFFIRKLGQNGSVLWNFKVDTKNTVTLIDAPVAVYEKDGVIYALSVVYNDEYDPREALDSKINAGPKNADVIIRALSSDKGELLKETKETLKIAKLDVSVTCLFASDEGFILSSLTDTGKDLIVHVGLDGSLKRIFSVETEGQTFYYYDATVQSGRLYLSAIALKDGAKLNTPLYEQMDIVGFDFKGEPDNELLSAAKAERGAALITVDINTCKVTAIYTADAGFGGTVKESENGFVWQLCKISGSCVFEASEDMLYPLITASASDCVFAKNGELVSVSPSDTAYTQIEIK